MMVTQGGGPGRVSGERVCRSRQAPHSSHRPLARPSQKVPACLDRIFTPGQSMGLSPQ